MGALRAGISGVSGLQNQSTAQLVGGGLRFDSSKNNYLSRTFGAGSRTTWTWAGWVKLVKSGFHVIFCNKDPYVNDNRFLHFSYNNGKFVASRYATGLLTSTGTYRDYSSWYHLQFVADTTNSQVLLYVNGVLDSTSSTSANYELGINQDATEHLIGLYGRYHLSEPYYSDFYLSNVYFIDGQALGPEYFGYTDPLTNVWRPKRLDITETPGGSWGTNGFYLPFDGSAPIGEDKSGNGNNWTPVNFGGSNTIEKATGALPILNTDGGGKVARVGVRTDAYADSLVLALPLVGIKSDFSNKVNGGTTEKAITATNAVASYTQSNFYGGSFYFDGSGDYLSSPNSTDYAFGTGDFTVETWVYLNSTGANQIFVGNWTSGTGWQLYFTSSTTKFAWYVNGGILLSSTTTPATGRWYHISVSRTGTTLRMFVNGVLDNSTTDSTNYSTTQTVEIGYQQSTSTNYLNGYLQDIRVYKGAAKYTSNFIPASTDPDIVPDSPSGVSYSSNLTQITDGAVAFDGSGDYLTLVTDGTYFSGNYTYEAFIYYTDTANNPTIFDFSSTAGNYEGRLQIQAGTLYVYDGSWQSRGAISANSWHHIAVTQSYVFVDGVNVGASSGNFSGSAYQAVTIGARSNDGGSSHGDYFTGFISNVNIVGTALYTSNFTPPSAPISSVENTKLLCCKSNSSATAFDVSPGSITANGNAAATNFNPFTVDIDTQRGKQSGYCTLNPLQNIANDTFSDGNLKVVTSSSNYGTFTSTMATPASGKWYAEVSVISQSGYCMLGLCSPYGSFTATKQIYNHDSVTYYAYDGSRWIDGSTAAYGATYTGGDLIGIAYDADNGTVTFYKNGVSQGVITGVPIREYCFAGSDLNGAGSDTHIWNFGQKPFKFPPPAGFQPLTLANLPRPSIVRPDQYVGIVTYTGNQTTRNEYVNFAPDFVWTKRRDDSNSHQLYDSVRGDNKSLSSDGTGTEVTTSNSMSFTSTKGINIGSATRSNENNVSYVAWCWKAGGNSNTFNIDDVGYDTAEAAGLTAGTITPTGASVNTKSKFSIITYTGNGSSSATVAHGLSQTPAMLILKARAGTNATNNWFIWHKGLSSGYNINFTTSAEQAGNFSSGRLGIPTDTTFGFTAGNDVLNVNEDETTYVVYAWAEIPGFSKFGSYTGNGNADGPVIITGFRPRWIMVKGYTGSQASSSQWLIIDTERDSYNVSNKKLAANRTDAENSVNVGDSTQNTFDILSNGFKPRTTNGSSNNGTTSYIYAAFAEAPTFNLYGAQSNAR